MNSGAAHREAGFTLIEVLVALAILGLALPVLLAIFSDTLHRTRTGESRLVAASFAETLLAGVGTETPLQIGDTTGDLGNGYRWRLKVEPYGEVGDSGGALEAYTVATTIAWGQGKRAGSLMLTTLRLAPKEAWR